MLNRYAVQSESKLGSVPNSSHPLKETGLLGDFSVKDAYGAARAARLSRRGTGEEGEGER